MPLLSPNQSYSPLTDETNNATVLYSKQLHNRPTAESSKRVEEEDIGELRRSKGKGKERAWDPEQGTRASAESYPPVNEDQDEERKVQENLARFAAKDMARRRAARLSRQMPSIDASSTSYTRRSILGAGSDRRDSGDATSKTPTPYKDPYETRPAFSPRMTPNSPNASPFDDPGPHHQPHSRTVQDSPPESPTTYGYAGPAWRGGGAPARRGERWWHALCAWGNDDEEVDDQAGRTNPFE